ncbi:MAG: hypothetical protein RI973_2005 [Bacteroidota bacterium]|jgi:lysophospholipase L1-like esterase
MKGIYEKYPRTTLVLFNIFFILLVAGLAEAYLRTKAKDPLIVYENKGEARVVRIREGAPNMSCTVSLDSVLWKRISDNAEFKPHRLRFDQDGFLMPSGVHSEPDQKIFFIGGSTTLCQDMDEESRFAYVAGKLLTDKTGLKVNTYNSSLYMNNTLHDIKALINKVLPKEPDIAVMMETCNDIFMLGAYGSYWEEDAKDLSIMYELEPKPNPIVYLLRETKNYLFPNLFQAAKSAFTPRQKKEEYVFSSKEYEPEQYAGDEFYVKRFRTNLKMFINICRVADVTPVLMTQAHRLVYPPDPIVSEYIDWITGPAYHDAHLSYKQYMHLQNVFTETIRKVGEEEGVKVIDLEALVPKTKEYLFDPVHYTEKGSLMVAEYISEQLKPLVLQGKSVAPQISKAGGAISATKNQG